MKTTDSQLLDEIVARITGAVHPLRIILFGSTSRGEMNTDSDTDLLIIMPDGTHRRKTSKKIFRELRGLGISKDVVIVTERDVAEHADNPSLILRPALQAGKELYAAG